MIPTRPWRWPARTSSTSRSAAPTAAHPAPTTWTGPGSWRRWRRTGYTGALCIESFTADNATIATAASIWRPLAETQDRLALDGLAFLRGIVAAVVAGASDRNSGRAGGLRIVACPARITA